MDRFEGQDTAFVIDEVSNIIKKTIEQIIGGNSYQHNKVNRWTADIVDQVLTELTRLEKPFKYIVQAVIMQKNGAGLHTASSCYWDNTTDGSCTVRTKITSQHTMCGRFACGLAPDIVRRLSTYVNSQTKEQTLPPFIDLMSSTRPFRSSWNIAPTSTCLCLISAKHLDDSEDSATRVLCSMRWGLVPSYHRGVLSDFKAIVNNCRTETIEEKPSFKSPLKHGQRCVILAEGYFEWKKNVLKTPYFIYQNQTYLNEKNYPNINPENVLENFRGENSHKVPLLAMAGIFDVNRYSEIDPLYSCTICTVDASRTISTIHPRMPAILNSQHEIDQWLDFGRYDTEKALRLLVPNNDLRMYRVTPNIGSTRTNDINNIRPITVEKTTDMPLKNLNTLDSFVIKRTPSANLDEPILKNETKNSVKANTVKRTQSTLEDYMFIETKSTAKRMKK